MNPLPVALAVLLSLAAQASSTAQVSQPRRLVVTQHVFEIDACSVKHTDAPEATGDPSPVSIAGLLSSTEPIVVPRTTKVRIGDDDWHPLELGPRGVLFKGTRYRGSFDSVQAIGGFGGGCLMGEFLHYLERNASGHLEVRSVEDPKKFFEGLWLVSKATEATPERIVLNPYRVVINRTVSREKVKDVPLSVGRPTVLSQQIEKKLTLMPEQMAMVAVPTTDRLADKNRLIVVVTAAMEKIDPRDSDGR